MWTVVEINYSCVFKFLRGGVDRTLRWLVTVSSTFQDLEFDGSF